MKANDTEYYNLEQAAGIMGLSPKTLKNRCCSGRNHPPVIKPAAGIYLFPKGQLHAWLGSKVERAIA